MHMSSLPRPSHENPIHHVALGGLRQEIRPIVIGPQSPGLLIEARAPPNIPRFSGQVGARFIHAKYFLQRVESGFVGKVEAVVGPCPHIAVLVELLEEFEVEFLNLFK